MDNYDYLEPNFNPKTLKVPELRRIFVFHSVNFPSSAKKSDLIEIFNHKIATRAAQLKAEFVNVAPEGKDIIEVPVTAPTQRASKRNPPSASPNKPVETSSETKASPLAKSKKNRPRAAKIASSSATSAESEDVEFSEYIHERVSVEQTVVVIGDSDDEENAPEADNKKRSLEDESAEPLRKKQELEGDVEKQPELIANTNSISSNSTSNEQEIPQTPAKQQVDHSSFHTPATSFKQEKSSSALREQPLSAGSGAGRRIKVREPSASPVAAIKKESDLAKSPESPTKIKTEPKNEVSSPTTSVASNSEEAETELSSSKNESAVEIKQESSAQDKDDSESASVIGQVLEGLLLILVVISLAFTGRWFAAEQFKAGYCGVTESPRIIQQWYYNPPQVWQDYVTKEYIVGRTQQYIDEIRPKCLECPKNAICSDGFHSECEPGYVKVESILSVGGYLPVPPFCKLDTSREDRYRKLKQKALEILRERNGRAVCGTDIDPKIEATELRRILFNLQKPSSQGRASSDEGPEESEPAATAPHAVFVQSTSESQLTAACQVHRAVAAGLERYGFQLKCLLVFAVLFRVLYAVLTARARRHARLERLADYVVDRLRQQIFEAEDDLSGLTMRGVEVSRAKREFFERLETLLPAAADESAARSRDMEALWKKIAKLVERSDLVEVKQAIIYGEIMRVWEYIGSTAH